MMRLRHWLVMFTFRLTFNPLLVPFEKSDIIIANKSKDRRNIYFLKARSLQSNEVWKQELREEVRGIYAELALKSKSDPERDALRLCILHFQQLEKRISKLSMQYEQSKIYSYTDKLK